MLIGTGASATAISTPYTPKESAVITIAAEASPLEVDAHNLSLLVARYLESCQAQGTSQKSVSSYRAHIEFFIDWWKSIAHAHGYVLSPRLLIDYREHFRSLKSARGTPYARTTVNTNMKRLRQYFRWLNHAGYVPIDMASWVPTTAAPRGRTRTVTMEQFCALIAACRGVRRIRNIALLCFLLETGVRRIEAANLRWEDVTFAGLMGYAHLRVTKRFLDDDKQRTVVFGKTSGRLIQVWSMLQGEIESDLVFGMANSSIGLACFYLKHKTGIQFSAHDLRRTFATHWLRNCATPNESLALRLLQHQLGHVPKNVTDRHYLPMTHRDVLEHYVSPLDTIDLPGFARYRDRQ